MAYKLGVLVIHGMGDQKADFADDFIKEVTSRLGGHASAVYWKAVHWAGALEGAETELLRNLAVGNDLDFTKLRRFVVHALGDAIAYQRVPDGLARKDVYEAIHAIVAEKLHDLREDMRLGVPAAAPEAPLVVIAHSLGAHIMSNHIWDLQRTSNPRKPLGDNPFERAETLAGIVTFGSNIPLFALAYNAMVPITFPARDVARFFPAGTAPAALNTAMKWLNLYDPDDILGYPLRPLSALYRSTVTEDRAVNVGGVFMSWNPASHGAYWTDNDVTKPVAQLLDGLLQLL